MHRHLVLLATTSLLAACATSTDSMQARSEAINQAITMCGIGSDTQTSRVYKAAYDVALKKGSIGFEGTMTQSIKAQEMAVLSAATDKSKESTKLLVDEIDRTRECVIAQANLLKPQTRADALEACREDVQNRLSPKGPIGYGVVRYWNQLDSDSQNGRDKQVMSGMFNNVQLRVQCVISDGRFEEAKILEAKELD